MKRLEIHVYNFPSTSHLKVIFYAFKKTAKYFGNKWEFFCFGGNVTMFGLQYNTIQFNNAIQYKAIQYNNVITFI